MIKSSISRTENNASASNNGSRRKRRVRRLIKARDAAYTFRLPSEIYEKFYECCYSEGHYMSDVLNGLIVDYLKENDAI